MPFWLLYNIYDASAVSLTEYTTSNLPTVRSYVWCGVALIDFTHILMNSIEALGKRSVSVKQPWIICANKPLNTLRIVIRSKTTKPNKRPSPRLWDMMHE